MALGFRQLLERQARYGGSKSLPVEPQTFREQHLLKLLLLVKAKLHPEPRGVRQQVLGECENALDVDLVLDRGTQFHLGEGKLLPHLVALPFVGLAVD